MFKQAKRRYIVGCKHRFKTLVCSVEMPYIMCQKLCLHPVIVLEIKSHILNPVTHKKEEKKTNLLWLQMNHDPRELSIFIHIQNIPTQGSLILTYPAFKAWMCAAGCHETSVCHPPTSVISRMLQFFPALHPQRKGQTHHLVVYHQSVTLYLRKLNETCP